MIRMWRVVESMLAAACLGIAGIASAENIKLSSGEVLNVTITEQTDTTIKFTHPVLGDMTLPKSSVTVLDPVGAVAATEAQVKSAKAAVPPPPQPTSFRDGWKGSVEIGLAGAEGNSENFNLRAGLGLNRITNRMETKFDGTYLYATDNGEKSTNRAEVNGRNDWLFENSKWGFFLQGKYEFDDFTDYDHRVSVFAGPSYTFVKNDKTLLRGRVGAGVTREIGGEDNTYDPEALIGVDFEHKLTARQAIFASSEYLPSLSDFPEFRLNSKAGYSFLVDEKTNAKLKAGVAQRHDSDPGDGFKQNDWEYFLTLGWDF